MTRDGLRLFYIPPAGGSGRTSRSGGGGIRAHPPRPQDEGGRDLPRRDLRGPRIQDRTDGNYCERKHRPNHRALPRRPSSPLSIALGLPLLKGERFEWVLQKGCELGADAFYPLMLERCEVRIQEKRSVERHRRWRRIVLEAAKQCDRVPPPVAHPLGDLESFLAETKDFDLKLMGYLGEHAMSAKEALSRVSDHSADAPLRAALLTGPEGDLTEEESGQALDSGFLPVSLGPRILRADTAPVSLVTIVQHALGDMG